MTKAYLLVTPYHHKHIPSEIAELSCFHKAPCILVLHMQCVERVGGGFSNKPVEVLLTQKGDKVRFYLSDAFLPSAEELGVLGAPDERVEGTVINFSDSGASQSYFAVVDVVRRRTIVVPVEKLEVILRHGVSLSDQLNGER